MQFIRNKKTGILEVFKDGKKVGEIITMGDELDGGSQDRKRQQKGDSKRIRS